MDPLAKVDGGGVPHPDKASGGFRLRSPTWSKTIRERSLDESTTLRLGYSQWKWAKWWYMHLTQHRKAAWCSVITIHACKKKGQDLLEAHEHFPRKPREPRPVDVLHVCLPACHIHDARRSLWKRCAIYPSSTFDIWFKLDFEGLQLQLLKHLLRSCPYIGLVCGTVGFSKFSTHAISLVFLTIVHGFQMKDDHMILSKEV